MFSSLRSRIILILVAAFVPTALVIGALAYHLFDAARGAEYASLSRDSRFLVTRLDAIPLGAARLAFAVTTLPPAGQSAADCQGALDGFLPELDGYSGAALFRDGSLLCEAAGKGTPLPSGLVSERDIGALKAGDELVRLTKAPGGPSVLWIATRGRAPDRNRNVGVIVIGSEFLNAVLSSYHTVTSSTAMLTTRDRSIIAGLTAGIGQQWPDMALPEAPHGTSLVEGAGDEGGVYTATRLAAGDVWLLTTQKRFDVVNAATRQLILTAVAPLALLVTTVAAIWFGLSGTVLRWASTLRKATLEYATGGIMTRVDASTAPLEFADLAHSFNVLADRVAERTQELEREVVAKTSYIRELHHRVKNNLQVIGSLLSLQKRELPSEQRAILRFPEDRINAMSAAYRATYAISEIGHAPLESLLNELMHRFQTSGDGQGARFTLVMHGEGIEVDLDTAISIAMLLAEILPGYVDASAATGVAIIIAVTVSEGQFVVVIRGPPQTQASGSPLSRRFLQAYLRQLNATIDQSVPGEIEITVLLPHKPVPPPVAGDVARKA